MELHQAIRQLVSRLDALIEDCLGLFRQESRSMHAIPESERRQLLAASPTPPGADSLRPAAPSPLSMLDYLRQVRQLARLLPQAPRPFARGDNRKL